MSANVPYNGKRPGQTYVNAKGKGEEMTYRIFKRRYTDRATGNRVETANYYVEFHDHNRIRHR